MFIYRVHDELCEALWSNCKRMQSSELRFFLCKKYELMLRLLRSNEKRRSEKIKLEEIRPQ